MNVGDYVWLTRAGTDTRKFTNGQVVEMNADRVTMDADRVTFRPLYEPGRLGVRADLITRRRDALSVFLPLTPREKYAFLVLIEQGGSLEERSLDTNLNRALQRCRGKGYVRRSAPPHVPFNTWIANCRVTSVISSNVWSV